METNNKKRVRTKTSSNRKAVAKSRKKAKPLSRSKSKAKARKKSKSLSRVKAKPRGRPPKAPDLAESNGVATQAHKPTKTKTCCYCKRRFLNKRMSGRPRVTCGRPACMKARKAEIHLAYMRKPEQKEKTKKFLKEYRQRPEVAKRLKQYLKDYAEEKRKEAGIRTLRPFTCPFCSRKYRPRSRWEVTTCGRVLCKKKYRRLVWQRHSLRGQSRKRTDPF